MRQAEEQLHGHSRDVDGPAHADSTAANRSTQAAGSAVLSRMLGESRGRPTHDGGEHRPLGQGDEVLDEQGKVIPAFSASPEGVVTAALYELHRGDERSMTAIFADQTAGRIARGRFAAQEGGHAPPFRRGMNTDAKGAQTVGHLGGTDKKHEIGPIAAYHAAVHQGGKDPWCGAFVAFVYQRAGIDIGNVAGSVNVDNQLALSASGNDRGAYFRFSGNRVRGRYGGSVQSGHSDTRTNAEQGRTAYTSTPVADGTQLDIRPGDVFWIEYSASSGHTGIVIGVHRERDKVTVVTVEGNFSDRLTSRAITITRDRAGRWSSPIKGWGRPAQLASAPSPHTTGAMPAWIAAAAGVDVEPDDETDSEATTR